MTQRKSYYAADAVFPFVAATADKSLGLVDEGKLARVNVLCTDMVSQALLSHRRKA